MKKDYGGRFMRRRSGRFSYDGFVFFHGASYTGELPASWFKILYTASLFDTEQKGVHFAEDDLVSVFPPDVPCDEIRAIPRGVECYLLAFAPSEIDIDRQNSLHCICHGSPFRLPHPPLSVVCTAERFDELPELPTDQARAMCPLYLSELVLLICASESPGKSSVSEEPLGAKVKRYLNSHITSPISLDALSRLFFVSKYYLCRSYKAYCGMSVRSYVTLMRVRMASRLIRKGETASAAAYKVGFGDYSSFYRAYKKYMGESPTESKKK